MNDNLRKILGNFSDAAETTLVERFQAIIDYETSKNQRWKELEEISGISTHSWQKAYLGKQRPTSEMLEAVAKEWPQYAFWLMCGITSLAAGNVCPPDADPWPSAREELEDPPKSNISWARLTKVKPHLKRYLKEEALSKTEEEMIGKLLYDLDAALVVSTIYSQALVMNEIKKGKGAKDSADNSTRG